MKKSSLQVLVPSPYRERILEFGKALPYVTKLEDTPHITVRAGIETNDVEEVANALGSFIPIRVMFGTTKMFSGTEKRPDDVLFIEVFGESLRRLKWKIETLDCDDEFISYLPHTTVAFMEPGTAISAVAMSPVIEEKFVVEEVMFASGNGNKYMINRWGQING